MSEEKIQKVTNPLTIIAVFAGLSEVAGTVSLPLVAAPLQVIFIWYLIAFPLLLVILFFLTLNFNPKVLYAPSDYKDEENFLELIRKPLEINEQFEKTLEVIAGIKVELLDERSVGDNQNYDKINHLEKIVKELQTKTVTNTMPSNVSKNDLISFATTPRLKNYSLDNSLMKLAASINK